MVGDVQIGTPPFRIPAAGRPQPALTALAFVAGAMVSRLQGQTGMLRCLKPAVASDLMQQVLGKLLRLADWGPKTSNRKVLDPLLRIGDANSNAA
jgi:hypothetical protein